MARAIPANQLPPEVIAAAYKRLGVGARRKRTFADIRQDPEHQLQSVFVAWARLEATLRRYPELDDLYAVPNFNLMGKLWGAYFNEEGRKRGQLDLVIPHARGGFHAAYLESKSENGKPSKEQLQRMAALIAAGNKVYLCFSAEGLKKAAIEYLTMEPTNVSDAVQVTRRGRNVCKTFR
jgi:hypothetical protein